MNNQPNIGASGILSFDGFGSTESKSKTGWNVSGAMDEQDDEPTI